MNRSKPGFALTPIIKQYTDLIYDRDPVRYQRLCRWVWAQQKAGWPDEAIARALALSNRYIDEVSDWWSFLQHLLPKGKAQAVAQESAEFKRAGRAEALALKRLADWILSKEVKGGKRW